MMPCDAMDPKRGRGRPRNLPGVPNANPQLRLRLEPWLHAWATDKGPEWHRSLLERAWKEVLAAAWFNGTEAQWEGYLQSEGLESCYLRQVRNRLGPAWLHNECSIEAVLR